VTTVVLDIGKTNLKLLLLGADGRVAAQRSRPNRPLPGPPWLHPDLDGIEAWLLASLDELARGGAAEAFVAAGHGSGGVLVDEAGPVLPSVDYEDEPPAAVLEEYARVVPPFPERGSPLMGVRATSAVSSCGCGARARTPSPAPATSCRCRSTGRGG
jgi:sugar (pentulose or hexulose) kinase